MHTSPRTMKTWIACAAGLMLALASSVAAAQSALPAEKTSHSVAYVSGGVGLDESSAMKAARQSFPLSVEIFSSASGRNEYTSSVPVTISKPNGEVVFDDVTDGPYTLLRLEPGRYVVKATYNGQTQQRRVKVNKGQGGAKASFVFKGAPPPS